MAIPHPFVSDLSDKSLEELQNTIQDLSRKLNFVYKTQNGPMINQMLMVIESYKSEYNKRIDEIYKKQNLQNKINISKDST
jgi:hypothetical protein